MLLMLLLLTAITEWMRTYSQSTVITFVWMTVVWHSAVNEDAQAGPTRHSSLGQKYHWWGRCCDGVGRRWENYYCCCFIFLLKFIVKRTSQANNKLNSGIVTEVCTISLSQASMKQRKNGVFPSILLSHSIQALIRIVGRRLRST